VLTIVLHGKTSTSAVESVIQRISAYGLLLLIRRAVSVALETNVEGTDEDMVVLGDEVDR
jgi:hypothetical protein